MRTQAEVEAEIKALEECKTYIPKHTKFGEDNHRNVDLQIEELRTGLDDTCEEWDELSGRDQDAVLEARDWKTGSENAPSEAWSIYKK